MDDLIQYPSSYIHHHQITRERNPSSDTRHVKQQPSNAPPHHMTRPSRLKQSKHSSSSSYNKPTVFTRFLVCFHVACLSVTQSGSVRKSGLVWSDKHPSVRAHKFVPVGCTEKTKTNLARRPTDPQTHTPANPRDKHLCLRHMSVSQSLQFASASVSTSRVCNRQCPKRRKENMV